MVCKRPHGGAFVLVFLDRETMILFCVWHLYLTNPHVCPLSDDLLRTCKPDSRQWNLLGKNIDLTVIVFLIHQMKLISTWWSVLCFTIQEDSPMAVAGFSIRVFSVTMIFLC